MMLDAEFVLVFEATAAPAAAVPPAAIRIAASAPGLSAEAELPPLLITAGTQRTPRCEFTGVTDASFPSAFVTPSGVLIVTLTPAGVLTTALPSSKLPPMAPSENFSMIFLHGFNSTQQSIHRLT